MEQYNHKSIEAKWQKEWEKSEIYRAHDGSKKSKFYQLETFPYPSAAGLHVGHPKGYIAEDIHARFMRALGKEVMYTMGWDAFGLPTENYAIKVGKSPKEVAQANVVNFKRQVQMFGLSYDWDREINTSSPEYYKWTQWLFIQLYKKGLAYRKKAKVNWCPKDQTVLANEQVINGRCERDGELVEQKDMEQWFLRITDYAEELLSGLAGLDWPKSTIKRQIDWIGKSDGAEIEFQIPNSKFQIPVFTTRPDTLFGATYMVLAPEHPLIKNLESRILNLEEVEKYIEKTKTETEIQRTAVDKIKTGVELKGVKAINPATKEEIPIWIADYVLMNYGTGAIMAVPAHDERDFEFAKKYDLPITKVITPPDPLLNLRGGDAPASGELYTGEGILVNSGKYDGLPTEKAIKKMGVDFGKLKVQYKLRDWSVSRQRYWGVPIPMVHCDKCGIVPVDEKDLPVLLPDLSDFRPKGMPPLASSESFIKVKCPSCGEMAKRDPETLDTFVDSSWYYLRYTDPQNDKKFADEKKLKYWLPIDLYVIGAEHTVLHLLYSRFITKFLHDEGYLAFTEPFLKLYHVGLIQGPDGQKMSKSRGNVVNPDEIVEKFGADTVRIYEMFMGPFEDGQPWDSQGVTGSYRFLEKIWKFQSNFQAGESNSNIHKLIKKISSDIPAFKFNTAIAAFMEFLNENKSLSRENWETFLILLAPFAPHITEELWHQLGHKDFIHLQAWPEYDKKLAMAQDVTIVVQVLGRIRATLEVAAGLDQAEVKKLALADANVQKYLAGKQVVKEIFVKDKLINFVTK